jgi:carboxypeptidase PM20D1
MKSILKWLGIALLLLIIIAVINTLRFKSKQLTGLSPAPDMVVSDSAFTHLAQAVRFRTVSYNDISLMDSTQFEGFITFIEKTYPLVHSRLKRERVNGYSLLFEWKGKNTSLKPALLMGHYDVVPVIQGTQKMWKRQPFAGEIDGGYVYGRGTLDDKSTVMGILEAVEYLLTQNYTPNRTFYLAFGHDEEVSGLNGAQKIVALLKSRKISLEFGLDEGGTIKEEGLGGIKQPLALIGIAEKGYASLTLTATGEGGHSSMPPTQTSIGMLAEALDKLQKNPFPSTLSSTSNAMLDYIGPEMGFGQKMVMANRWLLAPVIKKSIGTTSAGSAMLHTTIAPTMFDAGVKDNVLPIEASATVNFRIMPGETVQTVIEHVRKVIDNEKVVVESIKKYDSNPSPVADTASVGFRTIHRSVGRCFPEAVVAPYLVLGATDARFYREVCDNMFRFMPVRMKDEDIARLHGTNERVSAEGFKSFVRFYATVIQETK